MHLLKRLVVLTAATVVTLATSAVGNIVYAALVYDESVSPDFSGSGLSPTFLALTSGSNLILGTTGNPGAGTDRDYFSIAVPAGFQLAHLTVLPGTSVIGNSIFLGVQAGPQVTVTPTAPSASGLLGAMHYTNAQVGADILPLLGIPFAGSTGFTSPLAAGTYSFWVQDFGAGAIPYAFNFAVAAVPEPEAYALMLAGLGFLMAVARSRKQPLA
jgi:hypothetical protein